MTPSDAADPAIPTLVDPSDRRWTGFAAAHPDALPFHSSSWLTTLRETYGFGAFVLMVVGRGGDVRGGVPLMEVKVPLRGSRWVALPFTDRCPPLVADPEAPRALADAVRRCSADAGAPLAEVRAPLAGWNQTAVATMHVLDLTRETSALLRGFSSAARRNVRKAQREGVVVRRAVREEDLVQVYYDLHLRTRRRLGVPVQPRRFFRSLWRHQLEPGHGQLLLASVGGRAVAGAVFLQAGGTVIYKYGASDERAWKLRPNNLLFWRGDPWRRRRGIPPHGLRTQRVPRHRPARVQGRPGSVEQPLVYSAPEGQDASLGPLGGAC